jgi:hypothetical protein
LTQEEVDDPYCLSHNKLSQKTADELERILQLEALGHLDKFRFMVAKYYPDELVATKPVETVTSIGSEPGGTEEPQEQPLYYLGYKNYPKGMSDIMAMICLSVDMDPERDREQIDLIVENWIPEGNLEGTWKRGDFEFDMGMTSDAIVTRMRKIRADLPELFAENSP